MRIRMLACCGALLVTLALSLPARADETRIQLPNRELDPQPGVEANLVSAHEPGQVIVQLDRAATPALRARYERMGLRLRHHVGANAYLARALPGTDLATIPGLRWAGPLLPQDKIAATLWQATPTAVPADARIDVWLYFESDASPERIRELIDDFSLSPSVRFGPFSHAFRIRRDRLTALASDTAVFWIEAFPEGMLPR